MKVIKIDIKQELREIEMRGPTTRFVVYGPEDILLRDGEGGPVRDVTMENKTYGVIQHTSKGGNTINYLVPFDDHKIFRDLLGISDYSVQRYAADQMHEIVERLRKEHQTELGCTRHWTKKEIRDLPWWKRLFKKF